jgi:RNA 2',3'-cyclic 3'-phosphodiesterase
MTNEQIRTFIAVELPSDVRNALEALQGKLKSGGDRQVKWVEPENMHLTLHFLGNIDPLTVDKVVSAINQGAIGTHPFQIQVGGLGVFPNAQRVRVIWVGLAGDIEKLAGLQKSIGANLEPIGFIPEKRPFTPHLTLGRVKEFARPEERAAIGQIIVKTPFNQKFEITVSTVNLMKSQLTRQGPIYTRLAAVPLR